MGSCYGFSHPLGNAAHHYARFAGGGYDVNRLTPVISAAQNRLGQSDGFIGTTFYKTCFLEDYVKEYLDQILWKKEGRICQIVSIENSPTIGAAIAGLCI